MKNSKIGRAFKSTGGRSNIAQGMLKCPPLQMLDFPLVVFNFVLHVLKCFSGKFYETITFQIYILGFIYKYERFQIKKEAQEHCHPFLIGKEKIY